jgi:hypothetical protein
MIPVDQDVAFGRLFHESGREAPTILFFHGNGEIVTDYEDIGTMYRRMGIKTGTKTDPYYPCRVRSHHPPNEYVIMVGARNANELLLGGA